MNISELYRAGGVFPTSPGTEVKRTEANKPPIAGASEFHKMLEQQSSGAKPADAVKAALASKPEDVRGPLQFSNHAQTRIRSREIPWNDALEARISGGVEAAHSKGSREALILADNVAVIANVKSRTIITAMDRTALKEKIFTNIDSAVLV